MHAVVHSLHHNSTKCDDIGVTMTLQTMQQLPTLPLPWSLEYAIQTTKSAIASCNFYESLSWNHGKFVWLCAFFLDDGHAQCRLPILNLMGSHVLDSIHILLIHCSEWGWGWQRSWWWIPWLSSICHYWQTTKSGVSDSESPWLMARVNMVHLLNKGLSSHRVFYLPQKYLWYPVKGNHTGLSWHLLVKKQSNIIQIATLLRCLWRRHTMSM